MKMKFASENSKFKISTQHFYAISILGRSPCPRAIRPFFIERGLYALALWILKPKFKNETPELFDLIRLRLVGIKKDPCFRRGLKGRKEAKASERKEKIEA